MDFSSHPDHADHPHHPHHPHHLALRQQLIDALAVVAADASDQAAWVDRHDVGVDEIALNFDDAFRVLERLVERRQVDEGSADVLREIDALFAGMSGPGTDDRWTESVLSGDQGWNQVRWLARQALTALTGGWDRPLPEIQVIR